MSRAHPIVVLLAVVLWTCHRQGEAGGTEEAVDATGPATGMVADPGSVEARIASAESAAPADIARDATIMDWPAEEGGEPPQLRAGTNGWTCFPDDPATPGKDPACLDSQWMKRASAWMSKQTPRIDAVGIAYMLQGGSAASTTDPFATEPPPGEEWIVGGPHVMVITPDPAQLAALPTEPAKGGPWVVYAGTPYALIVVPTAATSD